MKSKQLQNDINKCWTVKEVCRRAGVTPMTVHLWRSRVNEPLPAIVINGDARPAIRFMPSETTLWARRNNVTLQT